jgi:hypothetical protein
MSSYIIKPFNITVKALWTDITYQQAKSGLSDVMLRDEYKGKVVGLTTNSEGKAVKFIVISESGEIDLVDKFMIKEVDYSSI